MVARIIFGTLIRVVYFATVLTILAWGGVYLRAVFLAGGTPPGWADVLHAWRVIEVHAAAYGVGGKMLLAIFAGLWWGAATHTLTDVGWSVARKSSEIF